MSTTTHEWCKPAEDECPSRHTSGAFRCVVSKNLSAPGYASRQSPCDVPMSRISRMPAHDTARYTVGMSTGASRGKVHIGLTCFALGPWPQRTAPSLHLSLPPANRMVRISPALMLGWYINCSKIFSTSFYRSNFLALCQLC